MPTKKKTAVKFELKLDKRYSRFLLPALIALFIVALLINFRGLFVVAVVNNRPITRIAIDRELEKQAGQSVLENEVVRLLILQEAAKQKVVVSEKDIDDQIKKLEDDFKAQGSDLEKTLASQGQSKQSIRGQIKVQLIVQQLLGKDIKITEEEIKAYYDTNKTYYPKDSTLDSVKAQIEKDLTNQKLSEKFQTWIEELKTKAKIYYFVKF